MNSDDLFAHVSVAHRTQAPRIGGCHPTEGGGVARTDVDTELQVLLGGGLLQRGQGDTGSGADAAFDRVDRADLGEPFGGQQYVIVLADRAGDHRSTPALGGDGLAAFLADLQDLGDFLGGSGPDQDARSPEIAPGVIDGSSGQDIGVRADVSLADDLDQGASERRHGPQCGIHIALRGILPTP
ncbi:Uncharacterised protein [Mycobacteroides abscessus subsp. abscessus]|nr:Uncharacterised protein [Mycobacteroides abscessus subsp. abscessus]